MALDEPNENDDVFDQNGYKFVGEKDLMAQASPVTIDVSYMGFTVNSSMPLGGGGCGSSCGDGGSCAC